MLFSSHFHWCSQWGTLMILELECFFVHDGNKLHCISLSSNLKITTDLMAIKMSVMVSKFWGCLFIKLQGWIVISVNDTAHPYLVKHQHFFDTPDPRFQAEQHHQLQNSIWSHFLMVFWYRPAHWDPAEPRNDGTASCDLIHTSSGDFNNAWWLAE